MKQIVVLGGGISGYGSAILAKKKGFGVFLSDAGRIADRYKAKLDEWEVPYEEGGHTEERILAATEVVKSPGIPDTAPMVRKIREAGIPVISEMEFAGRYMSKRTNQPRIRAGWRLISNVRYSAIAGSGKQSPSPLTLNG